MFRKSSAAMLFVFGVFVTSGLWVWAEEKKENLESERKVKENEVPAAAMAALKKLSGGAAFTEFAEEIEHGHKFYEGSWKGPDGNVDGLVTEGGDVVELEESIPATKVPAAVRAMLEKEAGKDVAIQFEKKTLYLYEGHFKKDGKTREMILTADGREFHEDADKKGEKEGDDKDED
ncbi:MAG: hypothetical protein AABZ47_02680 [Planctomycetota bacterium]